MKKLLLFTCMISLVVAVCVADNSSFTFDSDDQGWNSPGSTWSTTIAHTAAEGHDAAGAIDCTDADGYYGVRNTVTIGADTPAYTIEAWCKLISLPGGSATGGLNLDTWDLDNDNPGGTSVAFDAGTSDSWQSQTQSGLAKTGGFGYIMIWGGASGESGDAHTVQFFLDDITYTEGSSVQDWSLFLE